jgi:hypothetical protein
VHALGSQPPKQRNAGVAATRQVSQIEHQRAPRPPAGAVELGDPVVGEPSVDTDRGEIHSLGDGHAQRQGATAGLASRPEAFRTYRVPEGTGTSWKVQPSAAKPCCAGADIRPVSQMPRRVARRSGCAAKRAIRSVHET